MYNAVNRKKADRPTAGERAIQDAITEFWYEYYTKPLDATERNTLVDEFLRTQPVHSIALEKPFIVHPATRKKRRQSTVTLMEVLGDFIMRPLQAEEKRAEYPVWSQDTSISREEKQKQLETYIFFQGWQDGLDKSKGEEVPQFVVTEDQIELENSIEDEAFPRFVPPTVSQFRNELRRIKKDAAFYAVDWAEQRGLKSWKVERMIQRLDLSRVRECDVCTGAFYAHDLRQKSCDCQPSATSKTLSECQLRAKKLPNLRTEKTIS